MAPFSSLLVFPHVWLITINKIILTFFLNFVFTFSFPSFSLVPAFHSSSTVSCILDPTIFFSILQFFNQFFKLFLIFVVSIQFSSFISLASFKFIISWLLFLFLNFYPFFSPSSFFHFFFVTLLFFISQLHHCDDFLNIPWHFPPFLLKLLFIPLFLLPLPIQRSLFLFFSFLLRLFFFSHSSSFLLFQFQSSFLHSLALFELCLPSPCSSSVSSSISTSSFFFSPLFIFFLFSFLFLPLLFSSYPSVTIYSIFLVISWERCSPLPHFIHPCLVYCRPIRYMLCTSVIFFSLTR